MEARCCFRLYNYRFYDINIISGLVQAVTGIELKPAELLKVGERVWNLYKAINVNAGFGRKDDKPPEIWFKEPFTKDGVEHYIHDYHDTRTLTKEDVDRLIDDYYNERGWDSKTGIPSSEKLKEMGLEAMARSTC